ncbi:hypothetical protein PSQ19_17000 [Devosia algicola]|uniref:Uncharacterized protein n=1 Tax=Devosia algicola TaxID=3026418 RepID=A0ABY7YLY4_9HYPH|nr:hypothetical protein [Devosia algicola]WDR02306.1 hypothetical protein PSQ19_17000 [Devosia algicola]
MALLKSRNLQRHQPVETWGWLFDEGGGKAVGQTVAHILGMEIVRLAGRIGIEGRASTIGADIFRKRLCIVGNLILV